jgi:radical SAM protein with 4Fe4S-binding SPASM domain
LLYNFIPYPKYIEVEVTTRCNLKCIICERTYWNEPNRDMSFEEFKGIIEQFPDLKWIGLTGIGESFINKDFMKMLRFIKSKHIIIELYDTFYFIDEKTANELIDLNIDRILISLDAATKETYEKIRIGSNFDRVTKNLKNFFRLKMEKKAIFPEIDFHFIINKYNLHEIILYIELVHSIAKENAGIQFSRMLHTFKEVEDLFVEIPAEIINAAEEKAKKSGIKLMWNLNVPQTKPPLNECIEWTMPFIFVTGHVIPCCSGNESGHRDFQKETALGNIFEQSFKEIWHGEKYQTLRKMLSQGKVPPQCRNCCIYGKECVSS